jgi:hypothetical protein
MILRQQSYTISRSLTRLPIFPCLTVLLGERALIHFSSATLFTFSFAQLLHTKLTAASRWGWGMRKTHPTVSLNGQELQTTLPFQTKGNFYLLVVSSLKRPFIPLILHHWSYTDCHSAQHSTVAQQSSVSTL